MPNKRYKKGRNLEWRIKKNLEDQGYYVCRSAGSKGVADLVAIPPREHGSTFFISCKTKGYIPLEEKKKLIETAIKYNVAPLVTVKIKNKWELRAVII